MTVRTKSELANRYAPDVCTRAVRMVFENLGSRLIEFQSQKRIVAARAVAERKVSGHLS